MSNSNRSNFEKIALEKLTNKDCININNFKKFNAKLTPLISGSSSSYEEAINEAKNIIKSSSGIHIDGMGCDLKGIDKILDFSEENCASVDHMSSDETSSFYSYFQKEGGLMVSLGELKNRADLIIFVNLNENELPIQLISSLTHPRKKITFLSKKIFRNTNYKHIKSVNLYEDLNWLRNNFSGLKKKSIIKNPDLIKLLKDIHECKYGVIVLNVGLENEFLSKAVINLVKTVNYKCRLNIFLNGRENNLAGFIQSSLWRTGYPQRYNFTSNGPIYNPIEYKDIIMRDKKDLQIYISCFENNPKINLFKKNIFIGNGNIKNKRLFDVFIPTSVPGIDEIGLLVRSDHSCVLKVSKTIQTNYKSVSDVFSLMNSHEN